MALPWDHRNCLELWFLVQDNCDILMARMICDVLYPIFLRSGWSHCAISICIHRLRFEERRVRLV